MGEGGTLSMLTSLSYISILYPQQWCHKGEKEKSKFVEEEKVRRTNGNLLLSGRRFFSYIFKTIHMTNDNDSWDSKLAKVMFSRCNSLHYLANKSKKGENCFLHSKASENTSIGQFSEDFIMQ